jgi:hypothetical protein
LVIKPLEEDSTPGTVKPFQVSLVEPVAYQFQLPRCDNEEAVQVAGASSGENQVKSKNRRNRLKCFAVIYLHGMKKPYSGQVFPFIQSTATFSAMAARRRSSSTVASGWLSRIASSR